MSLPAHQRRIVFWPRTGALVILSALGSACGRTHRQTPIEPIYDKESGRLQKLNYDSNQNGKIDTVSYMDGSRILRIEIDKDEDGKVERWEYYDADQKLVRIGFSRSRDGKEDAWSYPSPDGSTAKIEISTRRDGVITRIEYYDKDAIVRAEEDSDANGLIDKWETYDGGPDSRLTSLAFDTLGKGRPDRRLVYDSGGAVRLEVDPDGDGAFVIP